MKLLDSLTEEEFEDFLFLGMEISPSKTGLKESVWVTSKLYFEDESPYIRIFETGDDINKTSQNTVIYLSDDSDYQEDVKLFLKLNKELLERYWYDEIYSDELLKNLKSIK